MRRRSPSQKEKDIQRATGIMNKLERFAMATPESHGYDNVQMSAAQVSAAQIILKKLVPDLSSVEQTIVDEKELLTDEQLLHQMAQLVEGSPDLAAKLRDMLKPTLVKEEKQA